MARYIGPKSRIARRFRDPIFGPDKSYEKKNYPPGMHGQTKRRAKVSEYGTQLMEYRLNISINELQIRAPKRSHSIWAFC